MNQLEVYDMYHQQTSNQNVVSSSLASGIISLLLLLLLLDAKTTVTFAQRQDHDDDDTANAVASPLSEKKLQEQHDEVADPSLALPPPEIETILFSTSSMERQSPPPSPTPEASSFVPTEEGDEAGASSLLALEDDHDVHRSAWPRSWDHCIRSIVVVMTDDDYDDYYYRRTSAKKTTMLQTYSPLRRLLQLKEEGTENDFVQRKVAVR